MPAENTAANKAKTAKPRKTAKKSSSSARTVSTKKSTSKKGPKEELVALLKEMDNKEISWLLTQAHTIIYNKKVNEVNKAARNLVEAKNRTGTKAKTGKGSSKPAAPPKIDIEQAGSSSNFNIIAGNTRLFLNLTELKSMVKIAQANKSAKTGTNALYRWMRRERQDMINDACFSGPGDPQLAEIYTILKDRYTTG